MDNTSPEPQSQVLTARILPELLVDIITAWTEYITVAMSKDQPLFRPTGSTALHRLNICLNGLEKGQNNPAFDAQNGALGAIYVMVPHVGLPNGPSDESKLCSSI